MCELQGKIDIVFDHAGYGELLADRGFIFPDGGADMIGEMHARE